MQMHMKRSQRIEDSAFIDDAPHVGTRAQPHSLTDRIEIMTLKKPRFNLGCPIVIGHTTVPRIISDQNESNP